MSSWGRCWSSERWMGLMCSIRCLAFLLTFRCRTRQQHQLRQRAHAEPKWTFAFSLEESDPAYAGSRASGDSTGSSGFHKPHRSSHLHTDPCIRSFGCRTLPRGRCSPLRCLQDTVALRDRTEFPCRTDTDFRRSSTHSPGSPRRDTQGASPRRQRSPLPQLSIIF